MLNLRVSGDRLAFVLATLTAVGCAPGSIDDTGDDPASAITNPNGLNPNGLNPNGLNPNGLNPNGLAPNGLPSNGLNPNGLNPNGLNPNGLNPNGLDPYGLGSILLSDPNGGGGPGDLSRQLLSKLWSCAFPAGDNVSYTWYDSYGYYSSSTTTSSGSGSGSGYTTTTTYWVYSPTGPHVENLQGMMNLAPDWHTRSLNETEKAWLTACVAARVNRYGHQMTISTRGFNKQLLASTTAWEVSRYNIPEASFFSTPGHSLFDASPQILVCHMNADLGAHVDSYDFYRTCGSWGLPNCGIMKFIGDCSPPRTGGTLGGSYYTYTVPAGQFSYIWPKFWVVPASDSTSAKYDALSSISAHDYSWTQSAVITVYDPY